jgi:WD40 repeat protein
VASGQVCAGFTSKGPLTHLVWNHDGTLVATGRQDGPIEVWDVQHGRLQIRLIGHEAVVAGLAFSHSGDLLASASWDTTLRLWNLALGQQLVVHRTQSTDLHFSPDDRTLAYAIAGESDRLLEVARSESYRRIAGLPERHQSWTGDFSPDGRLLAASTTMGIEFWDVLAGKDLGLLPTTECRSAFFRTNGELSLVGSTLSGLYQWPVHFESTGGGAFFRIGAPTTLTTQAAFRYLALDRSETRLLVSTENCVDPFLIELSNPTNGMRLHGHPGAEFVALDPADRWAATGTWKGTGVKVYDTSGRAIRDLPVKRTAVVAFTPDGNWLGTADMNEFRLWNTGSWESAPQSLPEDQISEINQFAFSPDGKLLALVHGRYEIQIAKVPTCQVLATLRVPSLGAITSVRFNPSGSKLAALEWTGQLNLWDLRLLREELRRLSLDWDFPPFPSESEAPPTGPAVLQLDAAPFSKEELAQTIPPRDPNAALNLIDLTDYYNAPLARSWYTTNEDGNDLSELPPGLHKFGGIEFDVRGLIQIGANAANGLTYPNHVHGIPLGLHCRRLHFLHAAILASSAVPGDALGNYVIHYVDGHECVLPLTTGKDLADWWSQPNERGTNFVIAWTGANPAARRAGKTLRLFRTTWENPAPTVAINQLDFTSDNPTPGQPFLLAVTVEP